ncbi:NUDIX domain-containing protein [Colletotrichum lupini]|uniref:NUDIX domain-containing protein n=1 Tax=Colletotrichum lupini TaxID=145971 RepID=A0A9Q8SRB3_9PEZI|nr:NUDIX domain-containing protein [Colletotrichum lupini]UQC82114.1 NUDIX domain-containing protein [Colletotrichum lupini]
MSSQGQEPRSPQSYLPLINKVDNVPLSFDFNTLYRLFLPNDSRPHGFMVQSTVERLPWTLDFRIDHAERVVQLLNSTVKDDEDIGMTCTAAFQRVVDAAIASDSFPSLNKLHSEHFKIIGANHFVSIERFPAPLFGISSRGAHMTAYVKTSEGMKIWVPRRSAHLFTFPNLLDTTVAGGVKAEDSPFDCIIAEATEEASLPADFVKENARAVGAVTYCSLNKQKGTFFPTVLYVYDLELPESIEPQPGDDEVSGFKLMSIDQVKDAMLGEQFKPNCVLVMLDFFIRHNTITSENNDEYLEIVTRMRRHLPVPTSPERRFTVDEPGNTSYLGFIHCGRASFEPSFNKSLGGDYQTHEAYAVVSCAASYFLFISSTMTAFVLKHYRYTHLLR